MTETEGRRWLLNRAKQGGWLYQPIESSVTGIGIPDGYFRTWKNDGWIELKSFNFCGQGIKKVPFRPGQFNWLQRHTLLGGNSFLFIFYTVKVASGNHVCICVFKDKNIKQEYVYEDRVKAELDALVRDIDALILEQLLNNSLIM